jgi:hypothetical protein
MIDEAPGRKLFPMRRFSRIHVLAILGGLVSFSLPPGVAHSSLSDDEFREAAQTGSASLDVPTDPDRSMKPERRFFGLIRHHTQSPKIRKRPLDVETSSAQPRQIDNRQGLTERAPVGTPLDRSLMNGIPRSTGSRYAQAISSNMHGPIGPWVNPSSSPTAELSIPLKRQEQHQPPSDAPVRLVQATLGDMSGSVRPDAGPLPPTSARLAAIMTPSAGGQSISLQTALYGALTSNPDLVTLRQGNAIAVSAEAVEVARHFPTTLNPTLWIDYRPITLIPNGTFGTRSPGGGPGQSSYYHPGQNFFYISLRQPVELGHQTTHRYHIAQAAYDQQRWTIIQAELTSLVQTYRFFQTAGYRREKYRLTQQLADFNDNLLLSLRRRMEANQVLAADVALARVESRAAWQQVKAARQDYLTALTDLRNQIGIAESAGAVEPFGEFTLPPYIPPVDEQVMIQEALQNRPDIHAAQAQITGTHSAVSLAKSD